MRGLLLLAVVVWAAPGAVGGAPNAAVASAEAPTPAAREWTTLQHDARRSGYSPVRVEPPYREKWYWIDGDRYDPAAGEPPAFARTVLCRRAQPVTDGRYVFVGSMSDNTLYAINLKTGRTAWRYHAGAAILSAATVAEGRVYFGDVAGKVHCLAASGESAEQTLWVFADPHRGSFYSCPAVVEGKVYIGSRSGWFFCLDATTGRKLWELEAGAPVLNSAAVHDGSIFFGDEAMYARRVRASDGKELWKRRLHGWTLRHHGPVVVPAAGVVIWRSNPIRNSDTGQIVDEALATPGEGGAGDLGDAGAAKAMEQLGKTPEAPGAFHAAQQRAREALRKHPEARTMFVLRLADGTEPFIAPAGYQAQHADVCPPPVALGDGRVIGYYRGRFGTLKGVIYSSRFMMDIGVLDMNTGLFDRLGPLLSVAAPFGIRGDDCARLSVAGDILYGNWNHRGGNARERNCGAWDLRTLKTYPLGTTGGLRKDDFLKKVSNRTGNSHSAVAITADGTLLLNHLGVAVVAFESEAEGAKEVQP